jgi:hypothetical protein
MIASQTAAGAFFGGLIILVPWPPVVQMERSTEGRQEPAIWCRTGSVGVHVTSREEAGSSPIDVVANDGRNRRRGHGDARGNGNLAGPGDVGDGVVR